MVYTKEVQNMCCVAKGPNHGPAPIPEEGKWVQAKEIIRLKKLSIKYLSNASGKSEEEIAKDMERDFYMTAEDAKEYGIVDHIMNSAKKGAR